MNILILSPSLKVGGGAEKFSAILGNELYKKGHKIYHLTFFDEHKPYNFQGEYATLNDIKGEKGVFKGLISLIRKSKDIKKICAEKKISVIISVGENANYHAVLSKYLFKNKAKIIVTQHINPEIHFKDKNSFKMIKFFYSKADKVVCVARGIENVLKKDYGLDNTKTIYNFLNTNNIKKKSEEKLPKEYEDIFKSRFIFINIGRLTEQKGQWFLIRSFRKVVDKHKDAKLIILGDGELKENLKCLIKKLDLEKNVFLLGNQENVFPFLVRSTCFVFSSLWEGFPLSLIESLAVDVPIISTDCKTGPREIICPDLLLDQKIEYPHLGKYGILTQPLKRRFILDDLKKEPLNRSEDIMADSILRMVEDPTLVEKYSKGFKFIKKMDKNKIMEEWYKTIE